MRFVARLRVFGRGLLLRAGHTSTLLFRRREHRDRHGGWKIPAEVERRCAPRRTSVRRNNYLEGREVFRGAIVGAVAVHRRVAAAAPCSDATRRATLP